MAITAWTDLDMDWTNPNLAEAKYYQALCSAFLERYSALSIGLRTQLGLPAYIPSEMNILNNNLFIAHTTWWKSTLDNYRTYSPQWIHLGIINMLPYYVNHTDNGGDWDGQTNLAPRWTVDSIMKATGLNELIRPNTALYARSEHMKNWAIAMYKIINLLRYLYYGDFRVKEAYRKTTANPVWTYIGNTSNIQCLNRDVFGKDFRVGKFNVLYHVSAKTDIYLYPYLMTYASYWNDLGLTQLVWNKYLPDVDLQAGVEYLTSEYGSRGSYDTIPENSGSQTTGGAVLKFDDVFTFKDW